MYEFFEQIRILGFISDLSKGTPDAVGGLSFHRSFSFHFRSPQVSLRWFRIFFFEHFSILLFFFVKIPLRNWSGSLMNPFWYTPSPTPAATFFPSSRYLDALSNSPKVAIRGVLWKKVFLKISPNSQENTCVRVSFLISCRPENTFFTEHLWTDASNSLGCSFWFLNQIFCLLPCVLFRKGSKVMLSTFFYIFGLSH